MSTEPDADVHVERVRENEALVHRLLDAWVAGDRETLGECFAPDAVHHTPGGTTRGEAHLESASRHAEVFEGLRCSLDQLVADESAAAFRYTYGYDAFEGEPLDAPATMEAMMFVEIEDGVVVESWALENTLSKLSQHGLLYDWEITNQYLTVLNRVLRHNLRNDLGAIEAYAELIAAGEGDAGAHAETIRAIIERLITSSDKAGTLQRHAIAKPLDPAPIDVERALDAAVDPIRERYQGATIQVRGVGVDPDRGTVPGDFRTDAELLERAVTELVDNAVEHNDLGHPHVEVRAAWDGAAERLAVTVADNGPGIPPHEVEPLEAATEEPLVHGSGVGLWAAKWSVERLEGDLAFADNEPRGTVATVTVPDLAAE